jgi:anti-sigma factor RsiW
MNLIIPHLKFNELVDLAEGRLAAEQRQALSAHLSTCQRCSKKLSDVEDATRMMRSDTMEDAPPYAMDKAMKLIRTRTKPATSILKRIIVSLKSDSLDLSQAVGVRAGATSERQIMFNACEYDLHLQIKQVEDQWIVSGQVLGPCTGGEVELTGSQGKVKTLLNELCEFTLDPTPEGTYMMAVRLSEDELNIPELKLGA